MKSSLALALFLTVGLVATFNLPARGSVFFAAASKHGAARPRTEAEILEDYAKFQWLADEDKPASAVTRIVVSLADQRLYAYHAAQLVAWSNVSTGRTGYETPIGAFDISQKDVDHHSSLYDAAPMPFFMRLTDGGVGLHAGFLPGYPASHGCIRMPIGMARELFQHVDAGTPVTIVSNSSDVAAAGPLPVRLAQD